MADLTTLARVKAQLKITDATDDAYLAVLISDVSDWIEEYTGRKLTPEAATSYVFDTAAGSELRIPRGIRTVSVFGVATTDQRDAGGSYTTLDLADVLIRPSPAERRPGWPGTRILIRGTTARLVDALNGAIVTGDYGFAATPPEIMRIADDAVVAAYQARRAGLSGVIGADDTPQPLAWASYFGWGSPQRQTLMRMRAGQGIA